MMEIIFRHIVDNRAKVMNILITDKIFLSSANKCTSVTLSQVQQEDTLQSNQKEADTKIILRAVHALQYCNGDVVVRSPSADTDILILLVNLIDAHADRVVLDYGCGAYRHLIRLSDIDMSERRRKCLIGFHSFTGCDYSSSFFRRSKQQCWKTMTKFSKFELVFENLGSTYNLSAEEFEKLEEFVCTLYGLKGTEVDAVRYQIFMKEYATQIKVVDLSLLPPCKQVLRLHSARANAIATMWKLSTIPETNLSEIINVGWYSDILTMNSPKT